MKKSILGALAPLFAAGTVFAEEGGSKGGSSYQAIIMMAVMVFFFYFILLRPEQKRRKKMREMRLSLKEGDDVIAMGIVGVVDKIEDTTVILKMVDGSKIEVLKEAVTSSTHPMSAQQK